MVPSRLAPKDLGKFRCAITIQNRERSHTLKVPWLTVTCQHNSDLDISPVVMRLVQMNWVAKPVMRSAALKLNEYADDEA